VIIIEGPDGAGKTTLCRKILSDFPELIIGERGTNDRKLLWQVTVPDTYRALKWAIDPQEIPRLWDRLFYSEFVYAYFSQPTRTPMFNPAQKSAILSLISAIRPPIILCMPPLEVVKDNILVEEQMDGVVERITDIYYRYEKMLSGGWFYGALVYDYTGENPLAMPYETIAHDIKNYLEHRREQKW
jgi:hypothetical protein